MRLFFNNSGSSLFWGTKRGPEGGPPLALVSRDLWRGELTSPSPRPGNVDAPPLWSAATMHQGGLIQLKEPTELVAVEAGLLAGAGREAGMSSRPFFLFFCLLHFFVFLLLLSFFWLLLLSQLLLACRCRCHTDATPLP